MEIQMQSPVKFHGQSSGLGKGSIIKGSGTRIRHFTLLYSKYTTMALNKVKPK